MPAPRNIEQELAALYAQYPGVFGALQNAQPGAASLGQSNFASANQLLMGQFDPTRFERDSPGFWSDFEREQAAGQLAGWTPLQYAAARLGVSETDPALARYYTGGLNGALASSAQSAGATQAAANTQQRTADITDVENLGARATAAYNAANPALAASRAQLGTALTGLNLGNTPAAPIGYQGITAAGAPGMAGLAAQAQGPGLSYNDPAPAPRPQMSAPEREMPGVMGAAQAAGPVRTLTGAGPAAPVNTSPQPAAQAQPAPGIMGAAQAAQATAPVPAAALAGATYTPATYTPGAAPGIMGAAQAAGYNPATDPGKLDIGGGIYIDRPSLGGGSAGGGGAPAAQNFTPPPINTFADRFLDQGAQVSGAALSPIQQAMQAQAIAELAQGGALGAGELRNAQNDARAAYSARGLGYSPAAAAAEILNTDALRRQRLNETRSFAGAVDQAGFAQQNANRQLGFNYAGLAAGERSAGADLGYRYAGLGEQARQFNAGQGQQNAQYYAGLGEQSRQANQRLSYDYAGLGQQDRQANQRLGYDYAGLGQQDRQFGATFGEQSRQFGASQGQQNRQYFAGLGEQSRQANQRLAFDYAGQGQQNNQYFAGLGETARQSNQRLGYDYAGLNQQGQMFNAQNRQATDMFNAQRSDQRTAADRNFYLQGMGQLAAGAQDPYALVLGRSNAPQMASGALNQATSYIPDSGQYLPGLLGYGQDLYNTNYNAAVAAENARRNNRSSLIGAGLGVVGTVLGGPIGGMIGTAIGGAFSGGGTRPASDGWM